MHGYLPLMFQPNRTDDSTSMYIVIIIYRKSLFSHMDGFVVRGHGSLLHSLRKGWVSMACTGDILRAGSILDCQNRLCNQLTGVGSDNVHAQNLVSSFISENLNHTLCV